MAKLRVAGLQLRALRAQMNPHFMFNVLNAIQGLVTSGRNADAESLSGQIRQNDAAYLGILRTGGGICSSRKLNFWIAIWISTESSGSVIALDFQIIAPPDQDLEELFIPTMIIQPFVENAIEHGLRPRQEGRLTVRFEMVDRDDNLIRCIVEDNGVGINKGREKQGIPDRISKASLQGYGNNRGASEIAARTPGQ
jgi:sensor histidine kinase YesM